MRLGLLGDLSEELTLGPCTKPLSSSEATALARFQSTAERRGYTVTITETDRQITATATKASTLRAATTPARA